MCDVKDKWSSPFHDEKKKSFSGSIIPSLLPILKLFLLFTFKKARTETSFQFVFSPLTFFPFFILFFPAPCFRVSAGGGVTLGWALQHYRQRVGELLRVKEREREAAEGGWVCPLQHHCTNRHGKGRKQEGVKEGGRREEMKWFNLGWV